MIMPIVRLTAIFGFCLPTEILHSLIEKETSASRYKSNIKLKLQHKPTHRKSLELQYILGSSIRVILNIPDIIHIENIHDVDKRHKSVDEQ